MRGRDSPIIVMRMSQLEAFRARVEAYLAKAGVTPTQFGKDAVNDPNFVRDLRGGRAPSLVTVDKVLQFINSAPAKRSRAAA